MVYKSPGSHTIHGVSCDYKVVDSDQLAALSKEGWKSSPAEAAKAAAPKKTAQTPAKKAAKKAVKKTS